MTTKNRVRILTIISVSLATLLLITGCAVAPEADNSTPDVTHETVTFPDGNQVQCLLYEKYKGAGVYCLWDTLTPGTENTHPKLHGTIETINNTQLHCVTYEGYTTAALECQPITDTTN